MKSNSPPYKEGFSDGYQRRKSEERLDMVCQCQHESGEVHCGLCLKPYACEDGMKHVIPSIEHKNTK